MPYSYPDRVPSVAMHWTDSEKRKCAREAQAVLDSGKSEEQAIFACIHAAGRSKWFERTLDLGLRMYAEGQIKDKEFRDALLFAVVDLVISELY